MASSETKIPEEIPLRSENVDVAEPVPEIVVELSMSNNHELDNTTLPKNNEIYCRNITDDDDFIVEDLESEFVSLGEDERQGLRFLAELTLRYPNCVTDHDFLKIAVHHFRDSQLSISTDETVGLGIRRTVGARFYYHRIRKELNHMLFPTKFLSDVIKFLKSSCKSDEELESCLQEFVKRKRRVEITKWKRTVKYLLTFLGLLVYLMHIFLSITVIYHYFYLGQFFVGSAALFSLISPAIIISVINGFFFWDEKSFQCVEERTKCRTLWHRALLSIPFLTTFLRDLSILVEGYPDTFPPERFCKSQDSKLVWRCTQVERFDTQALHTIEMCLIGCQILLHIFVILVKLPDSMDEVYVRILFSSICCLAWCAITSICHRWVQRSTAKYYTTHYDTSDILVLFSIVFFALDWFSDVALAVKYILDGKTTYAVLTVVFIAIPAVVTAFLSNRMYNQEAVAKTKKSKLGWLVSFIQLGPILRELNTLRFSVIDVVRYYIPRKSKYIRKRRVNKGDVLFLRMVERYLEAAPQLMLQVYIFTKEYILKEGEVKSEFNAFNISISNFAWNIFSIVTSLMSLAKVFTTLNHNGVIRKTALLNTEYDIALSQTKKRETWEIFNFFTFTFLATFCVIIFRLSTMIFMVSECPIYAAVLFFGLHWLIQLLLNQFVDYRALRIPGKEYICYLNWVDGVVAGAQMFAFVNKCTGPYNERKIMWWRLCHYFIFAVEDVSLIIYLFVYTDIGTVYIVTSHFSFYSVIYFSLMYGTFVYSVILLTIPPLFDKSVSMYD